MKKIVLSLFLLIFTNTAFSQSNYLTKFNQDLTPSPMVASLGEYGGVSVNKNSGGLSKSIGLLEVRQGDLVYAPSINYFSTGVKVNDWGSRIGINWADHIMPMISRTVKGIPDERALSRTENQAKLFGDGYLDGTSQVLNKVKGLAAKNTNIDGENDIFSYNLMGLSGEFIIVNNQAVLLKKQDNVKIEIVSSSPTYAFILTTPEGIKYDFSSMRETTKFSSENACDIDNYNSYSHIVTAWFATSMTSSKGGIINFTYSDLSHTYIYDYSESYQFTSYNNRPLPCSMDNEEGDMYNGYQNSKISCFRRKNTNTKILVAVTGDNFAITFNYRNRNDITGERLLNSITLSNYQKTLKIIKLNYTEYVSTNTLETSLENNLDESDHNIEANSLKTRYFLSKLETIGGNDTLAYKFDYIDPSVLPHRFSFSQDYIGVYNAKSNVGMVPKEAMNGLEGLGISYPFADRSTSAVGMVGMLNKIEYPTGGMDLISYEQNNFKAVVTHSNPASTWNWTSTGEDYSYDGSFFEMTVPVQSKVNIVLECFLDNGQPIPSNPDQMENYVQVQLWGPNGKMDFPRIGDQIELRLGQTRSTTFYMNGIPTHDGQLEFFPDNEYYLKIFMQGQHTALKATLYYSEGETQNLVDSVYAGYRVQKVITRSLAGPDIHKIYSYNHFTTDNGKINFYPNSSSLIVAPNDKYRAVGINLCYDFDYLPSQNKHVLNNVFPYETYRLLSNSNKSKNIYGGLPYAYGKITEFNGLDSTSFIASNYNIKANGYAGYIVNEYPFVTDVSPNVENFAWDHGLETERYMGGKSNQEFQIVNESKWRYSAVEQKYYNYSAGKIVDRLYAADDISNYIVNYYEIYSHFVKLDTLIEMTYSRLGPNLSLLTNITQYKYGNDTNIEEKIVSDSENNIITEKIMHPSKMVSLGLDPTGIYQEMVSANLHAPIIETRRLKNGVQIDREKMEYAKFNGNMYLPNLLYTQNGSGSPLQLRAAYNKYNEKGNLLEKQLIDGPKTTYIYSYKNEFIVAEIRNVDHLNIVNALGGENAVNAFSSGSPNESQLISFLSALRSSTALSTALVQTYVHSPLVGITRAIDAKGMTTYYVYDDFNRLKFVKDHNENIVKTYHYHYKP